MRHYDHMGTAICDVRVGNDRFGPWYAGALRPDAPQEKVRAFKASKPSGDWRPVNGQHKLVGILGVNVPGYPVVRRTVTASGVMVDLDGPSPVEVDAAVRLRVLAARAEGGIQALADIAG